MKFVVGLLTTTMLLSTTFASEAPGDLSLNRVIQRAILASDVVSKAVLENAKFTSLTKSLGEQYALKSMLSQSSERGSLAQLQQVSVEIERLSFRLAAYKKFQSALIEKFSSLAEDGLASPTLPRMMNSALTQTMDALQKAVWSSASFQKVTEELGQLEAAKTVRENSADSATFARLPQTYDEIFTKRQQLNALQSAQNVIISKAIDQFLATMQPTASVGVGIGVDMRGTEMQGPQSPLSVAASTSTGEVLHQFE